MNVNNSLGTVSFSRSKSTEMLIGFLISLILLSTITSGITSTFALLPYGKTYTNDIYEFKIQYPTDPKFEIEEIDYDETDRVTDIVTFYSTRENHKDLVADNFGVSVDQVDYDVTLQKYLDETVEVYSEIYEDFELLEQNSDSTLGGLPAYELVYSYTDKDIDPKGHSITMKSYETGLISEDKSIYFIQMFAEGNEYDMYYDLLKPYIDSFKLDSQEIKDSTSSSLTYSNLEHGILSLLYPSNYEVIDHTKESSRLHSSEGLVQVLDIVSPLRTGLDNMQDSLSISYVPLGYQASIDETKANIDSSLRELLQEDPNLQIISRQTVETIAGGNLAYKITYGTIDNTFSPPVKLKKDAYAIPTGDRVYLITNVAESSQYSYYANVFESIIRSLEFVDNASFDFNDGYDSDNIGYSSVSDSKYIELYPNELISENSNVIILVNPDSQNQSSKYVDVAIEAIQTWSTLLKKHSGNYNAWNFNITTDVGYLDTLSNSSPNAIILELASNPKEYNYCDSFLGQTIFDANPSSIPLVSTVLTSCQDNGKIVDLPLDDVYSTVLHEFAHSLGLGHSFNINNDLMCSSESLITGESIPTCQYYEVSGKIEPSVFDVNALLFKYGNDGFETPNIPITEYYNNKYTVEL